MPIVRSHFTAHLLCTCCVWWLILTHDEWDLSDKTNIEVPVFEYWLTMAPVSTGRHLNFRFCILLPIYIQLCQAQEVKYLTVNLIPGLRWNQNDPSSVTAELFLNVTQVAWAVVELVLSSKGTRSETKPSTHTHIHTYTHTHIHTDTQTHAVIDTYHDIHTEYLTDSNCIRPSMQVTMAVFAWASPFSSLSWMELQPKVLCSLFKMARMGATMYLLNTLSDLPKKTHADAKPKQTHTQTNVCWKIS